MRTQLASTTRRTCSRHHDRQATAVRVTDTLKPLPQQVRRPECAECAEKPLSTRQGATEKLYRL